MPKPPFALSGEHKRVLHELRRGVAPRHGAGDQTRAAQRRDDADKPGVAEPGARLRSGGGGVGARGRPSVPLRIDADGCDAVGATLHSGWMETVLVDFTGTPIARHVETFDVPDPRLFARTLRRRIATLETDNEIRRARFLGIGIAATGPVTTGGKGYRKAVRRLHGWGGIDLSGLFSDELGEAVWVENDATLTALAEYYDCDLAAVTSSALVICIGYGVGSGAVLNGELFLGDHGNAGEIGSLFPMDAPRPSGIGLLATLQATGEDIHSLTDIEHVMDRQAQTIDRWCTRAAEQLHDVVMAGAAWLDPGAIVVSGALPLPVLAILANRLRDRPMPHHTSMARPSIRTTRLGSAAVAIGAALLPVHAVTAK